MLLRKLYPCLELRDSNNASFPIVCPVITAERVWIFDGRCGRNSFQTVAARRQGALRIRGRGWTDGADHPRMAGLEDLRRRGAAARDLATREEGARVCMGAGGMGRQ